MGLRASYVLCHSIFHGKQDGFTSGTTIFFRVRLHWVCTVQVPLPLSRSAVIYVCASQLFSEEVSVPLPVMELCRKNVLVMDLVPGVRFVDGVRAHYARYAKSVGKTLEELEDEQKMLVRWWTESADSCRHHHCRCHRRLRSSLLLNESSSIPSV